MTDVVQGQVERVEEYGVYFSTEAGDALVLVTELFDVPTPVPADFVSAGEFYEVELLRFVDEYGYFVRRVSGTPKTGPPMTTTNEADLLDMRWVHEAEDILGGKLPAAYVAILRKQNGWGGLYDDEPWQFFSILDKTDRKSISKTAESIDRETKALRKHDLGFPDEGVVIADNGAGEYLFVRLDAGNDLYRFVLRGAEVIHEGDVWLLLDTMA